MTYVDDYVSRLRAIQSLSLPTDLFSPLSSAASGPSKADFANMILRRARSDFGVAPPPSLGPQGKSFGQKSKSVGLWLLDKLARPNYAVAEAVDEIVNENAHHSIQAALSGAGIKGGFEGFTGKEKTSFIDVLQEADKRHIQESPEYQNLGPGSVEAETYLQQQLKKKNKSAVGYGLAGDIILDPLNLIGVGEATAIPKAIKGLFSTEKALAGTEKVLGVGEDVAQTAGRETAALAQPTVPEGLSDAAQEAVANVPKTNIADVFRRDIRPQDYADITKAKVISDSGKLVDQFSKGNPAATDFLTFKHLMPLGPVARNVVDKTTAKIAADIANPGVKLTNFNATGQSAISNKLASTARQITQQANKMYGADPESFRPTVFNQYFHMLRNAEESMIARSGDNFKPRGGLKPGSPYLRLSDVLENLPAPVAHAVILGDKSERVPPSVILRAVTGDKAALTQISKKPALYQAITEKDWTPFMVKEHATRVIESANKAKEVTDATAGAINAVSDANISDVNKAAFIDKITEQSKNIFKKDMPAAKESMNDMLDGLRNELPRLARPGGVIEEGIQKGKYKLAAGVTGGKNAQRAAQSARLETSADTAADVISTEFGPTPGATSTKQIAKTAATDMAKASALAEGGILSTMLSWIKPDAGYKDLRPLILKHVGARRASATIRAHDIVRVFNKIPEKDAINFWNQVREFVPTTPDYAEEVQIMQKMMGNMFGESGLASKFAGNTMISRSGTNVEHLNKHLRIVGIKPKMFKFVDKVPDPVNPSKTVALTGPEILQAWKSYQPENINDLRLFAFNLSQAVENAMIEYSSFSQLGAIWGSKAAKEGYVEVSGMHPAINGLYFPKEIAPQIGKMAIGLDKFSEPLATSKFLKIYDAALRTWKSGVTIYAPSHHVRNVLGDSFLAWMDGLNNPYYYTKAGRILKANAHRYSDMDQGATPFAELLSGDREKQLIQEIMGQTGKRTPKGSQVIANVRAGGKSYQLTIDQVYQMGFRHGLFPHSSVVEDLPGTETAFDKLANAFRGTKIGEHSPINPFEPAKGKVAHAARSFSETREHFVRIAHYLYRLENPPKKVNSLEELFDAAAGQVRKFHPDGLDLTQTERRVFRRLIPFYSWNRKAIPLIVEGMVMKPNKFIMYPKIMSGVQESQGIESSVSDPWPDNQLFPDWLSGNVIGPTITPSSAFARIISRSPEEIGYGVVNPGLPQTDILEDFANNPVKGVGNSFTPFAKIPAELAFNQEFMTGAPIDDYTEYADKNIPGLASYSRMTQGAIGTGLLEGGDLRGKETKPYNPAGIINFLTGAGVLDTGRFIKGGEFDLKAHLAEMKKKEREKNGNR